MTITVKSLLICVVLLFNRLAVRDAAKTRVASGGGGALGAGGHCRHFMRQVHMVGSSHPLNSDGLRHLQKDLVVEQQGLAGRAVVAG